jgi:hypothetical protein
MLNYPETTTYSAPDASLAFQWRTKLSDREVQLIEHKAAELMTARGYALSQLPRIDPSQRERAALWLQNKHSIWTRMVGVYGLVPMLERAVGRRLGITGLEARGRATMDAITRRRVK